MSQLIVVETIRAIPGKSVELKEALLKMVPLTLKEPGCVSYEIAESEQGDDIFLVLMRWDDIAGLKAHEKSKHILDFVKMFDNILYSEVMESHWLLAN